MTYKLKITLNHHFKNIWPIFIAVIGFSLMPIYLNYKYGSEDLHLYIKVCFFSFLVFFIPQLVIHLAYYWANRGRVFYYAPDERRVKIEINNRTYKFILDDIEWIERNKSFALAADWYQWMPWDNYNYSVLRVKTGEQFVITSLLVPNMDLPIDESKIRLRKRFYCYPFGVNEVLEI